MSLQARKFLLSVQETMELTRLLEDTLRRYQARVMELKADLHSMLHNANERWSKLLNSFLLLLLLWLLLLLLLALMFTSVCSSYQNLRAQNSKVFDGATEYELNEVSKATKKLEKLLSQSDESLTESVPKHDTSSVEATIPREEKSEVVHENGDRNGDEDVDNARDGEQNGDGKEETLVHEEEPKDNFLDQLLLMSHQDMWTEIALTWDKFAWVRKVFQHLPSEIVLRVARERRLGPPPGQSLCANSTGQSTQHISSSYPIKAISGERVCVSLTKHLIISYIICPTGCHRGGLQQPSAAQATSHRSMPGVRPVLRATARTDTLTIAANHQSP